jgi:hypothetical protein
MDELGMLDPTRYQVFFDDFDDFAHVAAQYTQTAVSVGTGTSAVTTLDENGGVARITTAANEDDGLWAETVNENFLLVSGKKAWFKTRFKVGDAIQSDMVFGFHSTSTTPQAATMRFLFESVDGSAAIYFNCDDSTTDSDSGTVATLADDTYIILTAYYDGGTDIKLYADDVHVTTMTAVIPGAEMGVGFGYINGTTGAETTDIDYILAIKER